MGCPLKIRHNNGTLSVPIGEIEAHNGHPALYWLLLEDLFVLVAHFKELVDLMVSVQIGSVPIGDTVFDHHDCHRTPKKCLFEYFVGFDVDETELHFEVFLLAIYVSQNVHCSCQQPRSVVRGLAHG